MEILARIALETSAMACGARKGSWSALASVFMPLASTGDYRDAGDCANEPDPLRSSQPRRCLSNHCCTPFTRRAAIQKMAALEAKTKAMRLGERIPNTPEGWPQAKIRSTFVEYFQRHAHTHWPSSSVVPHDDPTLLFANAGMNQYKSIFLG